MLQHRWKPTDRGASCKGIGGGCVGATGSAASGTSRRAGDSGPVWGAAGTGADCDCEEPPRPKNAFTHPS
eukprot:7591642-Pyramimonas_sp.AAC.1